MATFVAGAMMFGFTPRSIRRGTVPAASFVCKVEKTRCPVRAACMAVSAVCKSRISPTRIMSGSWRRMDRSPEAKSYPFWGSACVWVIPGMWYSIGSSIVTIFISDERIFLTKAYRVVVLPDPVGPVVRIMPFGFLSSFASSSRRFGSIPKSSKPSAMVLGFRILNTTDSP